MQTWANPCSGSANTLITSLSNGSRGVGVIAPHATERFESLFFRGEMIAFGGCLLTAVGFFLLANRRAQKLSENAEEVHGSARWANPDDVQETGLIAATGGVYVGGWREQSSNRLRYLRHNRAGTRSSLRADAQWKRRKPGDSDPPGLGGIGSHLRHQGRELGENGGFRASQGHLCFKFSPVEPNSSSRFNPLQEVRIFTARDVSDAQNIAKMIVWNGQDATVDKYWKETAESIMTGVILHVCYAAAASKRVACLSDLGDVFTCPGVNFRETLEELLNFVHDAEGNQKWKMPGGGTTLYSSRGSEEGAGNAEQTGERFQRCGLAATTALTLYVDPLVASNTSASDFSVRDLVSQERPISLYLVVPPSDKERLRPLIRLIFTLIVNRLSERMEFEGSLISEQAQVAAADR